MDVRERFVEVVHDGDVASARALLGGHEEARAAIDEPLFAFDAPAIVYSHNNRAMVDLLLEYGANINAKSAWSAGGYGVLHTVDPEMAPYLIARGAEVDIFAAVRFEMMDRVEAFLASDPSMVDLPGPDGQRPLHFARSLAMMDCLLDAGADINARCVDHQGTAAQYLVNESALCRHLIARGAEVDIFMASALGDVTLTQEALDRYPEGVNGHTPQGFGADEAGDGYRYPPTPVDTSAHIYVWTVGINRTPHMVAAGRGHAAVYALLLERSSWYRRLIDACGHANRSGIAAALAAEPDMDRALSVKDAGTLFGRGFYEYYYDTDFDVSLSIHASIDAGFSVGSRCESMATPLHWASWYGSALAVDALLERGAEVNAEGTAYGGTPLSWACHGAVYGHHSYGGHYALIERLLSAGADASRVTVPTGDARIDALLR